ncbi:MULTISPECIES: stage II sporulation protein M [unclassified Sphingomonas]|uniref:stage II sporulation protein M n=1 Tax=unclassified Sphingomonas TaxID=196159 RepID=UPI0025F1FED9|nr:MULTISPECIES: stage II sporulation protein M [unclassified Sphingomonas]
MSAFVDAAPPPLNASRFRAAHGADWARLDALLGRIEKRSVRVLADDDLLALPLLYRSALSSLSVARETSLDRALVAYLEQLCARAYFQIYGVSDSAWRDLGRFFTHGWPAAVASLWRETLVMAVLTLAGTLAAYALVRADPSWFFGIIPEGLAGGRDPGASAAMLRNTLYTTQQDGLGVFASFLFGHNAQIAIFAFALGFAFVVPTALLVLYNGLTLGAMIAVFADKGLGPNFGAWLAIHGTTELFAIMIAGAAGMRIGTAIAFPGAQERMVALVAAGRTAAVAVAGVVLMLAVAAILEGVGRQVVTGDGARLGIGAAMLAAWLVYYYGIGRRHAHWSPD